MTDLEEIDRDAWDVAWGQMEVRDFPSARAANLNIFFSMDFGEVISATISAVPYEYQDNLYFPSEVCPVCKNATSNGEDVRVANLSVDFELIHNLACPVWIHEKCFQPLPLSEIPPPIPW